MGIIMSHQIPDVAMIVQKPWFPFAVYLGFSFFCIFNLMGYVANNIGVTVTSVASKLSMVIPVTAAILLYHDSFPFLNIIAVLLALAAVFLVSLTEKSHAKHMEVKGLLLAFLIFLGSGIGDSIVNYASVKLMRADEFNSFNVVLFSFASLCGIVVLIFQSNYLKRSVPLKAVAGGILLGIPNYFSLLFLIKALHIPGWKSSVVFPINNMGIVVLTAVCAFILFREKLLKANLIGLGLALVAILLMIFA